MCGIIGYTGEREAKDILCDGLKRLEYRGYDSAGIVVNHNSTFFWRKCKGNIKNLIDKVKTGKFIGANGLGHTRWATHGEPSDRNAHPHFSCNKAIAIVHNGIIENYQVLKEKLSKKGHKFLSETDSEIIAHLIEEYYDGRPLQSVAKAVRELEGSFAIGVMFRTHPNLIIGVRYNSPLIVGLDRGQNFIASDIPAILPFTRRISLLDQREIVMITPDGVNVYDFFLNPRRLHAQTITWDIESAEKSGYPHYMLKEIHEQPARILDEISGRIDEKRGEVIFDDVKFHKHLKKIKRVILAGCGSAYHATIYAKYAIESLAKIPCDIWLASEIRYSETPIDKDCLFIVVSQSGETADSVAALRNVKQFGAKTLAVCNIKGSSATREADGTIYMRAGLEIGVAATKTYISQVLCLCLFSIYLTRVRARLSTKRIKQMLRNLKEACQRAGDIFKYENYIKRCAERFKTGYDFMFIGRRYNLATVYEAALKMKEISYLHAEGYGGGEMKHGPLALVDTNMATGAVVVKGSVYDKMLSNVIEIKTRGGKIIALATQGDEHIKTVSDCVFYIPMMDEIFTPIFAIIPFQLLAYYTATGLGRNVDQPRNLAKCVTVE
jgi:glucosamine--fructose-6-phosphate aminotransferase (isomerizing)